MGPPDETDDPTPSVPELPFADRALELVASDLKAARDFLTRQLSIEQASTATAVTISTGLIGLSIGNDDGRFALGAVPVLLALAYTLGVATVHRRRAASRVRSLESIVHAHLVVLREGSSPAPVRRKAVKSLRSKLDRYTYGVEGSLQSVGGADFWRVNRRNRRLLLFGVLLAIAVVVAWSAWPEAPPGTEVRVCAEVDGSSLPTDDLGDIADLDGEVVLACVDVGLDP